MIKLISNTDVSFSLVGTDSLSVGKVSWTIISQEKTIQIETNGKVSVIQSFSKSGEYKVTAVVETICKTKTTLTRTENVQINDFNLQWIKGIGDYTDDTTFTAMVESKDGGCVAVGSDDFTRIISLDASGNILWRKDISESGWRSATSIVRADDGDYIMGVAKSNYNYGLIKISENGEKVWEKAFKGGVGVNNHHGYDQLVKVINASDGGYILAGYSSSFAGVDKSEPPKNPAANRNYTLTDYWIIKVNSSGVKEWDKTIGGDSQEVLSNIVSTSDGGYVLLGTSFSGISGDKSEDSNGTYDSWMVKISRTGVKEWDRSFVGRNYGMIALPDGSVILNVEYEYNADKLEYIKIGANGQVIWQKNLPGQIARMLALNDGGFIMVGKLDQFNVLRFNKDGEIQNAKYIDLAGSNFSYRSVLTKSISGGFYGLVSSRSQIGIVYIK